MALPFMSENEAPVIHAPSGATPPLQNLYDHLTPINGPLRHTAAFSMA